MGVTEWALLIVVVILIPLVLAVVVTLWSLEQARQRSKLNRPGPARRRVALPGAAEPDAPDAVERTPTLVATEAGEVPPSPADRH